MVMARVLNLSIAAPSLAADDDEKKESRNCIQTRSLKTTAVVDDQNVLFVKKGNSVYHNILPKACKGLSKYKLFSYTTTSGNLCELDKINVVDGNGRETRTCSLGVFYEISTEELRTLVENSQKP